MGISTSASGYTELLSPPRVINGLVPERLGDQAVVLSMTDAIDPLSEIEELHAEIVAETMEMDFLLSRPGEQIMIETDELALLHEDRLDGLKARWQQLTGELWKD